MVARPTRLHYGLNQCWMHRQLNVEVILKKTLQFEGYVWTRNSNSDHILYQYFVPFEVISVGKRIWISRVEWCVCRKPGARSNPIGLDHEIENSSGSGQGLGTFAPGLWNAEVPPWQHQVLQHSYGRKLQPSSRGLRPRAHHEPYGVSHVSGGRLSGTWTRGIQTHLATSGCLQLRCGEWYNHMLSISISNAF